MFTERDLEGYLDEALPAEQMAAIEQHVRRDGTLVERLSAINARRDAGLHSLGDIWRRGRLSCASRDELGSYLLGALGKAEADYLRFHLEIVGCRYCQANLEDLRQNQSEAGGKAASRRRKYFESSAGYLRRT
jgi:hypothetical protein